MNGLGKVMKKRKVAVCAAAAIIIGSAIGIAWQRVRAR